MNCTDKFLKYSERVGARFAEHNAGVPAYYFLILFLLTTPSIFRRCRTSAATTEELNYNMSDSTYFPRSYSIHVVNVNWILDINKHHSSQWPSFAY